MKRLAAVAAALAGLAWTCAVGAVETKPKYVYYEGIVASVNHETGDLVIMGNREDAPEEVIVKFRVDPGTVEVTNSAQQELDFARVEREDQIDVDCRIDGGELVVENIYIYGTKAEDGEEPVERRVYDGRAEAPAQ